MIDMERTGEAEGGRGMTREEAIDLLDNLIGMVEDNHNSNYDTALQMAIKALEQEPCEDCISRQAAIDACLSGWNKDYKEIVEEIRALPPVTPQLKTGHWIDGVCSECGWDAGQEAFSEDANFCMKCGVKMLPIGAEKENVE